MKNRPEFRDVLNHLTSRCAGALERMADKTKGINEKSEVGELADKATNKATAKRELAFQVKQGEGAIADQLGDLLVSRGLLTDQERGEIVRGSREDESVNESLIDIVVRDIVALAKDGEHIDEEEFLNVLSQHQDHIAREIENQLKQQGVSVIHAVSFDTAPYDPATEDLRQRKEEEEENEGPPKDRPDKNSR